MQSGELGFPGWALGIQPGCWQVTPLTVSASLACHCSPRFLYQEALDGRGSKLPFTPRLWRNMRLECPTPSTKGGEQGYTSWRGSRSPLSPLLSPTPAVSTAGTEFSPIFLFSPLSDFSGSRSHGEVRSHLYRKIKHLSWIIFWLERHQLADSNNRVVDIETGVEEIDFLLWWGNRFLNVGIWYRQPFEPENTIQHTIGNWLNRKQTHFHEWDGDYLFFNLKIHPQEAQFTWQLF